MSRRRKDSMTLAAGRPYRHLLELVDKCTTPGPPLKAVDWTQRYEVSQARNRRG